jgi:hypothetical protein
MDENLLTKDEKNKLIETFEDVKEKVRISEQRSRSGLMLGLQELGSNLNGFIGAYYPVSSNIIVMNKTPLRRIKETNPSLIQPYEFHVLLHEYIHTLGILNEEITRRKTYEISKIHFGEEHIITQLATNIQKFLPNLVYPVQGWIPPQNIPAIEILKGFDRASTDMYIT